VDSLKANIATLEDENRRLREFLSSRLGNESLKAELALLFDSTGDGGGGGGGGWGVAAAAAAAADAVAHRRSARAPRPNSIYATGAPPSASSGGALPPALYTSGAASSILPASGPARLPGGYAGSTSSNSSGSSTLPQEVTLLEKTDYALIEALNRSQQNFVLSDPGLPDNRVVFACQGFYDLTGYTPPEVLGRNCRFLQGPDTDPAAIALIRMGVAEGRDTAVVFVNYKKDGTRFWNRLFVAPLRGVDGAAVNFVGVQCEIHENVARSLVTAQAALYQQLWGAGGAAGAQQQQMQQQRQRQRHHTQDDHS
jgi:PAS domain S-box-containing protein